MWVGLRKYGLEFCDFPTMLSNVSALLWTLALDVDGRNNKRVPAFLIILLAISMILYVYTYVIPNFMFIFKNNAYLTFVSISLVTSSVVAVIQLFYMMFYREKLKKLTNKYLARDALVIPGSRYSSNMLKTLRTVKRRGITYWVLINLNAVLYLLAPLLRPGRHLTLDWYIIYGLEPMMESPNYEIASVTMALSVLFICYTVASVKCFTILTIGYNEAHILSLSEEMINLWKDAVHHYQNNAKDTFDYEAKEIIKKKGLTQDKVRNKFIQDRLAEIINQHAVIISNLKEIENTLRGPNAIANLLLIISLIAELVGGLEHTYLQVPFTMIQLTIDCYLGQKVIDSSVAFERAIYGCNWEMFNVSNRRIVLVILQNSQKTMKLSVGGMATLSFSCLMSIITNAYSAYTTLRSTVK